MTLAFRISSRSCSICAGLAVFVDTSDNPQPPPNKFEVSGITTDIHQVTTNSNKTVQGEGESAICVVTFSGVTSGGMVTSATTDGTCDPPIPKS